jgi:NADPH:quinone reductase-like Zn-dependent oxidoreductase
MRAVIVREFGPPEVLEVVEIERPEPAAGEVLVRVEAIGLNPVEAFARSGSLQLFGPPPLVLGWDIAGTVEEADPQVDRFAPGDRVFGLPLFPRLARGYAEYVAAPADHLAVPPAGLDAVHAAGLPLVGLTAWQSLVETAAVQPGQHVLIHAAGGGVGHIAVQLAKTLGARVTATASPGKLAFVKELGADTVIDYRSGDLAAQVQDVDVVLDPVGGDLADQSIAVVRPGGVIVSLLRHADEDDLAARITSAGRRFAPVLVRPDAAGLEALAALVSEGKLRVHVERTFGFGELAQAHHRMEGSAGRGSGSGITGKLVAVP